MENNLVSIILFIGGVIMGIGVIMRISFIPTNYARNAWGDRIDKLTPIETLGTLLVLFGSIISLFGLYL